MINTHAHSSTGYGPTSKYLVEELHVDLLDLPSPLEAGDERRLSAARLVQGDVDRLGSGREEREGRRAALGVAYNWGIKVRKSIPFIFRPPVESDQNTPAPSRVSLTPWPPVESDPDTTATN